MIRVLFIVLAVVALGLAVVLGLPWLYLVSAGLLVGAAVALTLQSWKRHRQNEPEPVTLPSIPADDLKSFGILEIRPKSGARMSSETARAAVSSSGEVLADSVSGVAQEATDADASMTVGDGAPPVHQSVTAARRTTDSSRSAPRTATASSQGPLFESVGGRTSSDHSVGTVRKHARSARIMVEGVSDEYPAEVMISTLRALRAAVDATTVCLLAMEPSPLRYRVEAIISRNAFARNGGAFNAQQPLVSGARPLVPVIHEMGSGHEFESQRLGYYHEKISVHQVAFVPIADGHGDSYFLVADTMEHQGLETLRSRRLLTDFGRLIGSLIGEVRAERPATSTGLRPRREIIDEEMERARVHCQPLSLALIHLNVPESDDRELVETRQKALAERLHSVAPGDRVERFGDLTFGVFRSAEADDMARWASHLQIEFADEQSPLEGGVSVGVAVLGDRHDGPDELRADATRALRESFESGECVILE